MANEVITQLQAIRTKFDLLNKTLCQLLDPQPLKPLNFFDVDAITRDNTLSSIPVTNVIQTVPHPDFVQKVQLCPVLNIDPEVLSKEDEDYIIGLKMEDIVIGNVVEKWKKVIYNIYKHLSLPLILFKNYLKEGRDTTYLVSKFSDTELIDICNYLKIVINSSDSKLDKINLIIEYLNNNV